MSFYSSLIYYRPGPPTQVTTGEVADFLVDIAKSKLLDSVNDWSLYLKFGEKIDSDDKAVFSIEETEAPVINQIKSVQWDAELATESLAELAKQVRSVDKTIYRAIAHLGVVKDKVCEQIFRHPCEENEDGFYPCEFGLDIGPIKSYTLDSEDTVQVGWMSISVSGDGYLFPWTPKDLVERAKKSIELIKLASICRKHWPVPHEPPDEETLNARKQLGDAWPHEKIHVPLDWCWGVTESG